MVKISPKITLLTQCLLLLFHTSAQQVTSSRDELYQINEQIRLLDSLIENKKYKDSKSLADSLTKDSFLGVEERVYLLRSIGEILLSEKKFDSAKLMLDAAQENLQSFFPDNHYLRADIFFNLGTYFKLKGNPIEALRLHKKALSIRREATLTDSRLIVKSLREIGWLSRYRFYDFANAKDYYLEALNLNKEMHGHQSKEVADDYYNLTTIFRLAGDLEKAETYGLLSLKLHNQLTSVTEARRANAHIILANVYFQKYEFKEAEKYANRAITILNEWKENECLLSYYYNTMGSINQGKEEYSTAISYYTKALAISKRCYGEKSIGASNQYLNLGVLSTRIKDFENAKSYLLKAYHIRKDVNNYGVQHSETARSLRFIAEVYEEENEMDSALVFYHKALISIAKEFRDEELLACPESDQLINNYDLLRILRQKAHILKSKYEQTENEDFLIAASQHYSATDQLITANRKSYQYENSKLFVSRYNKTTYENAIELASYSLDQDYESSAELIFQYMINSKSQILIEHVKRFRKYSNESASDDLLATASKVKGELTFINKMIEKEKNEEWYRQKLEKMVEFDSLQDALGQLRFNLPDPQLSNIQSLSKQNNAAVLQYLWGDETESLYCLAILPDTAIFQKISLQKLRTYLDDFLHLLQMRSLKIEDHRKFSKLSFTLCKLLIPEAILIGNYNELIVAGDGKLSLLPFEALLTDEDSRDFVDYRNLPYLIKKLGVSYYPSVVFTALRNARAVVNPKVLAMSYSIDSLINKGQITDRSKLEKLPGSSREIAEIQKIFDGKFIYGGLDGKENFLDSSKNHDIIHLAIHGEVDLVDHNESKLIFNDGKKDSMNIMYSYEIPGADLDSKLVVLSACNTGLGIEQKGEGTYSLSRSLFLGGATTTVSSLWRVDDKNTAKLMSNFYRELENGSNVHSSLRKSKLRYLEESDEFTSHPHEWASFILMGNGEVSYSKKTWSFYIIIPVVFALLTSLFFLKSRKRLTA